MEIIQRDSQMHYRVQEWIADSLSGKPVTLTPDEIGAVWGLVEEHIKVEQKTIDLAKEAIELIGGSKTMQVQSYLLEYLLEDEEKHDKLLERLEAIQKGMYPYG
jgi:bacterioferritin (cytochrome b1)